MSHVSRSDLYRVLRHPHSPRELAQINLISRMRREGLSDESTVNIIRMYARIRCGDLWESYEPSVVPVLYRYVRHLANNERIISYRLYLMLDDDDVVHLLRGIKI
jgi:hypothetical protein